MSTVNSRFCRRKPLEAVRAILQRMSYDIFECVHQEQGDIKVWFKKLAVGGAFEFTRNGVSSSLEILEIIDNKVVFEDNLVAIELDMSSNRFLQDDQSLVTLFVCRPDKFTM